MIRLIAHTLSNDVDMGKFDNEELAHSFAELCDINDYELKQVS